MSVVMISIVFSCKMYDCLSMQASPRHVIAIVHSNDDQGTVNQNRQFHDLRGKRSRAVVILVKMHYFSQA